MWGVAVSSRRLVFVAPSARQLVVLTLFASACGRVETEASKADTGTVSDAIDAGPGDVGEDVRPDGCPPHLINGTVCSDVGRECSYSMCDGPGEGRIEYTKCQAGDDGKYYWIATGSKFCP
jgi:hypothetical protein